MLPSPQIKLIIILTIICAEAKKPPGYMEPPKVPDPNPPKYEYGYKIADAKGDGQGKQEQRDGIYALGRYYVQGKESSQNVQYFADDWGYHPVVEYSSVGPHSRVTSHFALGEEAVKQLKNKENNRPQLQGILDNADKLNQPNEVLKSQGQEKTTDVQQQQQVLFQPQQEERQTSSVFPTTVTFSIPETTNSLHQQQLQLQYSQESGAEKLKTIQQQELLNRHSQEESKQQQQSLQQQEQQSGQFLDGSYQQQKLEGQSKEENLSDQQIDQLQLHHHQQQIDLQADIPKPTQLIIVDGKQPLQQQLLQQEQLQQEVYIQQPQIQQQVSIQELQLQPQHAILRHEEPSQKIIFPQEQQVVYQQVPQDVHPKQHLKDNIISHNEGGNQQLVIVQEQQEAVQPREQLQIQTNIIHAHEPQQQISQHESTEEKQYETAALFESSDSKLIRTQQLSQVDQGSAEYDQSNLSGQDFSNFGSKHNSVHNVEGTSNKLIEHTKNLVTGQDVLNINEAIFKNHNEEIDSSTPTSTVAKLISTAANTFSHSEVGYSTTSPSTVTELGLNEQPIVVADFDENSAQSTTERLEIKNESREQYYSSTATDENAASNSIDVTEPSTVLVTPRPVSTKFLAPITAGIQLQNIELHPEERHSSGNQNIKVEIQQSVPYYLGKFEYPSVYEQHVAINETSEERSNAEIQATENIELGKTLLFFPGQSSSKTTIQRVPGVELKRPISEVSNYITLQKLPSTTIKEKFVATDQEQAQGYQHQVAVQHVSNGACCTSNQVSLKPTEVTQVVHKPYPVRVPYEVPYPVIKQVNVPVTVEKIVEKPIHITKYVEKPVPVPQPYPVEKIVERPVHIPVQITKYIDRPYPVEVRVPYPQPYPVEKVVQKVVKQPYPVEVRVPVPVEKIVERKVPVPHYIEKPVEKIVEKPVPHYVDRPVPVEVKVPVLQPYLVRVEVPKPYPVDVNKGLHHKPYGLVQLPQNTHVHSYLIPQRVNTLQTVQVPTPTQIYSQTTHSSNQQEQHAQQSQHTQTFFYANPYTYAPQINNYLPPKQEIVLNNGYLPIKQNTNDYLPPKKGCNLEAAESSSKNLYYTIRPEDYIGLLPPKQNNNQVKFIQKLRTARSNFDDKSVRMEYGFLPPLIPSLEIDEQGNPIEKGDK